MGKFTTYDETWIDVQIQSQINIITRVIRENIPYVRSIILTGGFGRGEGSVEIANGRVTPLKDYDFAVIVDKLPPYQLIKVVHDRIYAELMMPNPNEHLFRSSSFEVDLGFFTEFRLRVYADLSTYELKKASHLLQGENIDDLIPWEIEDIPLSSGLRFLFLKTIGLIGHFSLQYLREEERDLSKYKLLIYECYKTYVEIASVLCFMMKCYEPSFSRRMKLFQSNFQKQLPDLYQQLPFLPQQVIKATKFKLKPDFRSIKQDPVDLWFETRDSLCTVLKCCLENFVGKKISDWTDLHREVLPRLGQRYYKTLVQNALSAKTGIHNQKLATILALSWQVYQSSKYAFQLTREYKTLHLASLVRPRSPVIDIYLTSPLILLSPKKNGDIDMGYFREARRMLNRIMPLKKGDDLSWEEMRVAYLKAYNMYGGVG